jgi:hypothetical protein
MEQLVTEIPFKYVKLGYTFRPNKTNDGGFTLCWAVDGFGCGELAFYSKDDKTICETDNVSHEFVKQAIGFWLDSVKYKEKT